VLRAEVLVIDVKHNNARSYLAMGLFLHCCFNFLFAQQLDVGGEKVTADKILVAPGGWPTKPSIPGIEHAITSNEVFFLPSPPKRIIIVGGGYIAIEFANVFNGYGSKVTQMYRGDLWLRGFDNDVRNHLTVR
jgi:glutathione reductase (NADPH)